MRTPNGAAHSFKILLLLPTVLDCNNGYQVDILATWLARNGHSVLVSHAGSPVPDDHLAYGALTHVDLFENTEHHLHHFQPDLIHAWTPREIVRILAEKARTAAPETRMIVHYEDNEERLVDAFASHIIAHQSNFAFYDRERGSRFVDSCDGFTFVVPTLDEIVPVGSRPVQVVPATYDDAMFPPRSRNDEWRASRGISSSHLVLVYPGNVHLLNRKDVEMLYEATALLSQVRPLTLVRTGGGLPIDGAPEVVLDLGTVSRHDMPDILAAADIFVQPGRPGPFDRYRFPSKIPEMAAIGRPIVAADMPALSGFVDREEVFKCEMETPRAIYEAVEEVAADPDLMNRLSAGASRAARRECHPDRGGKALTDLYARL